MKPFGRSISTLKIFKQCVNWANIICSLRWIFYKKYAQIRQAVRDKKQSPNNRKEALLWLENAEISLKKAKNEYARIIPYAKRNRYTDAQLNVELIDENIENIAQERDFVLKYF